MKNIYDVIKRPLVTEKSQLEAELYNRIMFRVDLKATKPEIKRAVEEAFDVSVVNVNTSIMPGKPKRFGRIQGRRSPWKKAIVTLAEGDSIDFYGEEEEL